ALRATIVASESGIEKKYLDPWAEDLLEEIELGADSGRSQRDLVEDVTTRVQREFSFWTGERMIRFIVIRFPNGDGRLLIVAHHFLLDGVSVSLVAREIGRAYRSIGTGIATRPIIVGADPRDWPIRLDRYAGEEAVAELPMWRKLNWAEYMVVKPVGSAEPADDERRATFSDDTGRELHRRLNGGEVGDDVAML